MTAREAVLTALRSARGLPVGEQVTEPIPVLQVEGDPTHAFERNARALLAEVHRTQGWQAAWQHLESLIRARGWQTAATWGASAFPQPGLADVLARSGCRALQPSDWVSADVGITGADAGIAATGTIVLASGPGKPRSVSLLPPVHVALLAESRIVPTIEDWLVVNAQALPQSAGVVFVSGPSRSGDIEMVVTLGVHGPGEVHIVLVCSE
ncbi:MAG: lactate utilization protein [Fimbriimonadia bacterium]|jgi:L-lactate utilization protein LutC